MSVPSRYVINVARKYTDAGWDGNPAYAWFCTIDAGTDLSHAKKVAEAARDLFLAPEFQITLHQSYESRRAVAKFGEGM